MSKGGELYCTLILKVKVKVEVAENGLEFVGEVVDGVTLARVVECWIGDAFCLGLGIELLCVDFDEVVEEVFDVSWDAGDEGFDYFVGK